MEAAGSGDEVEALDELLADAVPPPDGEERAAGAGSHVMSRLHRTHLPKCCAACSSATEGPLISTFTSLEMRDCSVQYMHTI